MKYVFTSESVTKGHPDKVCDQISDAILDACLLQDPYSRVACETTAWTDGVHIMGEITTKATLDYEAIARATIRGIGYTHEGDGFAADSCKVYCTLHQQSADIALGVDHAYDDAAEIGAGDQGMMFGFACDETENYMPMALELANRLTWQLTKVREDGTLPYLKPDGKAQVTVEYEDGEPVRVDAIVVSTQHAADVALDTLREDIRRYVIDAVIPAQWVDEHTRYFINPTGRFVIGGPAGDTGLTGRKIIADTYGGYAGHGGGAFSGKDGTKVDRSAAYLARYIAKNIVANRLARRCEIQFGYAIGVSHPVSVHIDTKGTGVVDDDVLCKWVMDTFDATPNGIIKMFDLRKPIYHKTSAYGHFGKKELPWEQIDTGLRASFEHYIGK